MSICPKCHKEYSERPALSRVDNTTEICPDCGLKEALNDFAAATHTKHPDSEVVNLLANYIYFEGTRHTTEGNWIHRFSELANRFDWLGITEEWLREHYDDVRAALYKHPGVLDVWGKEETGTECFDVNYGTLYYGGDV